MVYNGRMVHFLTNPLLILVINIYYHYNMYYYINNGNSYMDIQGGPKKNPFKLNKIDIDTNDIFFVQTLKCISA